MQITLLHFSTMIKLIMLLFLHWKHLNQHTTEVHSLHSMYWWGGNFPRWCLVSARWFIWSGSGGGGGEAAPSTAEEFKFRLSAASRTNLLLLPTSTRHTDCKSILSVIRRILSTDSCCLLGGKLLNCISSSKYLGLNSAFVISKKHVQIWPFSDQCDVKVWGSVWSSSEWGRWWDNYPG